MLGRGEKLPVDFTNRFIYYVGPVDPVRDEVVGPAGPTTATRMDKFTETMLAQTGLIAMVGKAERGPVAIEAIKEHKAAYLMAVGGAAYLVAKAIRKSQGAGLRRTRHGGDLRIRGQGHAGDRGRRLQRNLGARDGPARVEGRNGGIGGSRLAVAAGRSHPAIPFICCYCFCWAAASCPRADSAPLGALSSSRRLSGFLSQRISGLLLRYSTISEILRFAGSS